MENYLQRAWSDAVDNIDIDEIKKVIVELQKMDDEHGAFWVSVVDEQETILEIDKNINMIAIFSGDDENCLVRKLNDWDEALLLFDLLLKKDFGRWVFRSDDASDFGQTVPLKRSYNYIKKAGIIPFSIFLFLGTHLSSQSGVRSLRFDLR